MLKAAIPRSLPRDYDTLVQSCHRELDDVIRRLRDLEKDPTVGTPRVQNARLRQFRRAAADIDHLETTAISALSRALESDHHANRLLYKICVEIGFPVLTPTVSTMSSGYFYIDTKLNLMFIPLAEGSFLLHLPDLYHELGHPLLTHKDHPVLDRLRQRYLKCTTKLHDYFLEESEKQALRRAPSGFGQQLMIWELLWSKYWLTEFFCDLFAVATLGPAFAWSHLHLFMKSGGSAYAMPDGLRNATHPADDARMRVILEALRSAGFQKDVEKISGKWAEAVRLGGDAAEPEYMHCYPDELVRFVVDQALEGVREMDCRVAAPSGLDPVRALLNEAWLRFWSHPASYQRWEADAVRKLWSMCGDNSAGPRAA